MPYTWAGNEAAGNAMGVGLREGSSLHLCIRRVHSSTLLFVAFWIRKGACKTTLIHQSKLMPLWITSDQQFRHETRCPTEAAQDSVL
jgi:hypothetical protein